MDQVEWSRPLEGRERGFDSHLADFQTLESHMEEKIGQIIDEAIQADVLNTNSQIEALREILRRILLGE